jgi:hypothetical protein
LILLQVDFLGIPDDADDLRRRRVSSSDDDAFADRAFARECSPREGLVDDDDPRRRISVLCSEVSAFL